MEEAWSGWLGLLCRGVVGALGFTGVNLYIRADSGPIGMWVSVLRASRMERRDRRCWRC